MNRHALGQLHSPGLTAEDIVIVMANRDLETTARLDYWGNLVYTGTPWAIGVIGADGELEEGLEEFEWEITGHDDGWWEQNWGGRT